MVCIIASRANRHSFCNALDLDMLAKSQRALVLEMEIFVKIEKKRLSVIFDTE